MQKYKIITYGCQMNLHESEKAAGILRSLGYEECDREEDADIILFNTDYKRKPVQKGSLPKGRLVRHGMFMR